MAKKLRVGILFGGRSGEHEVSLLSAASILKAIDRRKFEVLPIGITKSGQWLIADAAQRLLEGQAGTPILEPAAVLADDQTESETASLLDRTREAALTGRYEAFKTTARVDGTARRPDWLGT